MEHSKDISFHVKVSKLYLQNCFKGSLLNQNVLQIEVLLKQVSNKRIHYILMSKEKNRFETCILLVD